MRASIINYKVAKTVFLIMMLIIILNGCGVIFTQKDNKSKTSEANDYYSFWKKTFIVEVGSQKSRVVDPENNNITSSEGMGYGLLFSATVGDLSVFDRLWEYTKSNLDEKGLMNWEIDANGSILGLGSATDADQDIAYALLLASKKWTKSAYLAEANGMIKAIKNNEISADYLLLSGDKWGGNQTFNPSYFSPSYYVAFGELNKLDKDYWQKVSDVNLQIISKSANEKTGLLPDWVNKDGSVLDKNNKFGYEALRVPLRLMEYYKKINNPTVKQILVNENDFFSSIGASNLIAGYSVTGNPLEKYINTAYLSAYTAASLIKEGSEFNTSITAKLRKSDDNSYYGSSLKLWLLLIKEGKLI